MNNNPMDGLNVGVGNIDVLKGTDIGVLRNKKDSDHSTYTRTTKPDGTVVEKVKMNKDVSNKGVVDLQTDGVNLGDNAANVGMSGAVSEDIVGFVDSIWGSKQVAGATAERRLQESQQQTQTSEIDNFRAIREQKLREEAAQRQAAQGQVRGM